MKKLFNCKLLSVFISMLLLFTLIPTTVFANDLSDNDLSDLEKNAIPMTLVEETDEYIIYEAPLDFTPSARSASGITTTLTAKYGKAQRTLYATVTVKSSSSKLKKISGIINTWGVISRRSFGIEGSNFIAGATISKDCYWLESRPSGSGLQYINFNGSVTTSSGSTLNADSSTFSFTVSP